MESKTKHRILGILVVAGLIVIFLPFLQSGKELTAETTTVKAPPFPDQSIQVTTSTIPITTINNSEEIKQQPDDTIKMDHLNSSSEGRELLGRGDPVTEKSSSQGREVLGRSSPVTEKPSSQDHEVLGHSGPVTEKPSSRGHEVLGRGDLVSEPRLPRSAKSTGLAMTVSQTAAAIAKTIEKSSSRDHELLGRGGPVTEKPSSRGHEVLGRGDPVTEPRLAPKSTGLAMMATKHANKKIKNNYIHDPIDDNGLYKLQEAAWVIQVGSFKNKAAALRVVNNLRANGYRAFIQQISTSLGDNTQVFIGPENKQTAARELAQALENDMHMHGIVISYKPLAL